MFGAESSITKSGINGKEVPVGALVSFIQKVSGGFVSQLKAKAQAEPQMREKQRVVRRPGTAAGACLLQPTGGCQALPGPMGGWRKVARLLERSAPQRACHQSICCRHLSLSLQGFQCMELASTLIMHRKTFNHSSHSNHCLYYCRASSTWSWRQT